MKVIGIVGSRRRNTMDDYLTVVSAFGKVYEEGDWICSGGCPTGADAHAEMIAHDRGIPILIFYPDRRLGLPLCYFVRNTKIAEQSDVLIARVASDRKGGTEDTIKKFKKFHPKRVLILLEDK